MIRTSHVERFLAIVLVVGVGLYELFHAIFDGLRFVATSRPWQPYFRWIRRENQTHGERLIAL